MRAKALLFTIVLSCYEAIGAVSFDGTDDFLQLLPLASVVPYGSPAVGNRTISFWLKRYNTNSCHILIEEHATLAVDFIDIRFNNSMTNRLEYFYTGSPGITDYQLSSEPDAGSDTNVWHHYVIGHQWDSLTSPRPAYMYKDGRSLNATWTTGDGSGTPSSSYEMYIGKAKGAVFTNLFGEMDEFCYFYATYLTHNEVQVLAKSKLHGAGLMLRSSIPDYIGGASSPLHGISTSMPFNNFPEGTNVVGTFIDASHWKCFRSQFNLTPLVNFSASNGPVSIATRMLSYWPNE